jgi:hypothetical protein
MEYLELNFRGEADSAFPADAGFLYDKAAMIAAVLSGTIKDTVGILIYSTSIGLCVLWLAS